MKGFALLRHTDLEVNDNMRVGIMTIWSANFGNRLQNYALQETLRSLGCEAFTLRRERMTLAKRVKRVARGFLKRDRLFSCRVFDDGFMRFSAETVSAEYVSLGLAGAFDWFVIGSDQVWNPEFPFNSELEYLPTVDVSRKVAYAASFGIEHIVAKRERTAELLNGIKHISVREHSAASLVKELTGRVVPVVLDPVMLLGAEDWRGLARRPKGFRSDGSFLVKYMIGDVLDDAKVAALARRSGLRVIDASDEGAPLGPQEFLWLLANASFVCTDSFHAAAFSVLFHVPFAVVSRRSSDGDMSTRLTTLLQLFGLENRFCPDGQPGSGMAAVDWSDVDARLGRLRESSLLWLRSALGVR